MGTARCEVGFRLVVRKRRYRVERWLLTGRMYCGVKGFEDGVLSVSCNRLAAVSSAR